MMILENINTPVIVSGSPPLTFLVAETDAALLEAARTMDKETLVRIFDLYSTPLYNYALRLCHDPQVADHIVGDVFAKFLDQLSAGHGTESNLRSYLYQMTYHLFVDEVRYARRRAPMEVLDSYYGVEPAVLDVENRLTFEKILHVIRTGLTDDQRHVIILRFLEGMNVRETAEILGKREVHVKVIQNRAIKVLRRLLCS